jgi:hypothetical protein
MTQQHDTAGTVDFDAFFAERRAQRGAGASMVLFGRTYTLPTQVPLAYSLLTEALADRSDLDALRQVLEPLFGADALDFWIEQGMGDNEFSIVCHWAAANMKSPGSLSEAEAAELVEAADAGKAKTPEPEPEPVNRAERRAAAKPKKKAASSGARS